MTALDAQLAGDQEAQYRLSDKLENVKLVYDYILLDCPPALTIGTRMALVAASHFLIPIESQVWAVSGSKQLMSFVNSVRRRANPELKFLGMVINKYMPRRSVEQDMREMLREKFCNEIFSTELKNLSDLAKVVPDQKFVRIPELLQEIESRV